MNAGVQEKQVKGKPIEQPEQGFTVQQPFFSGSLTELAHALHTRNIMPQQIDVLKLVQDYLVYFNELSNDNLDLASEALPMVARIVELKVRFLLPRPPKAEEEAEEELLQETLAAVILLEELENAIEFLRQRRAERRIILPATMPRPDYPRAERPIKIGLTRLAEMASRYSFANYFEMAIERITMATGMKRLMQALRNFTRGKFSDLVESKEWEIVTVTFAGMLELFKEGKLRATQETPYAPIELELETGQEREAA
ncbi:MAG: segregation and condensation protein A [Trueperaceae bacterium]